MASGSETTMDRLIGLSATAYRLAVHVLGRPAGAEDVVQEAYLKALGRLRTGSPPSEEQAWFLKIVANVAKNHLRSNVRRKRREAVVGVRGEQDNREPGLSGEMKDAVRAILASLEPKYRLPLALCYQENMTQRQAATILELPESTVSKYVNVGLAKLRKALEHAGYPAAVAAVLGGLKQTAPTVPASLAGRVEALVAQSMTKTAAGTEAASASAAAKGGIAMKVIAGIVLAGAVLAGVAVLMKGGGAPLPAAPAVPAAPVERKDPDPNQVYRMEPVVGVRNPGKSAAAYGLPARGYAAGPLDGPGIEADFISNIADLAVDDAGNCYWTESSGSRINVVRMWRFSDDRVITLAGSASGHLDGPIGSARFGGWGAGGYGNSLIEVTRDGKHLFLKEPFNGCIRHIDLEAGTVTTVTGSAGAKRLCFSRDASGEVYVFDPQGGKVPEGKGYKTLQTAKLEGFNWGGQAYRALDVAKGRFYNHDRYEIRYWDLKTGKKTNITPPCTWQDGKRVTVDGRKPALPYNVSGPLSLCTFYCPVGLVISPSGRYLYIGSGDGSIMHRLDLVKNERLNLAHNWADGTCSFKKGTVRTTTTAWPCQLGFAADGTIYWGSSSGIVRLVPVKKGANP